jgi:hypothetical protein
VSPDRNNPVEQFRELAVLSGIAVDHATLDGWAAYAAQPMPASHDWEYAQTASAHLLSGPTATAIGDPPIGPDGKPDYENWNP